MFIKRLRTFQIHCFNASKSWQWHSFEVRNDPNYIRKMYLSNLLLAPEFVKKITTLLFISMMLISCIIVGKINF